MSVPDSVNIALIAITPLVSAILVPILTNWLTAKNADGAVKQLVAGGLSLLVALIAVAISGSFDLTNVSATIVLVISATKISYEAFSQALDPVSKVGPQIGAKPAPAPVGEAPQQQ